MSSQTAVLARGEEDLFDLDIRVNVISDQHELTAGPTNLNTCCNVNGSSCTCPGDPYTDAGHPLC